MNDLFARMQIGQSSDLTVLELFSSLTSNIELNTVVTYENIRLKALPCEKLYDESGYQFLVEIAEWKDDKMKMDWYGKVFVVLYYWISNSIFIPTFIDYDGLCIVHFCLNSLLA